MVGKAELGLEIDPSIGNRNFITNRRLKSKMPILYTSLSSNQQIKSRFYNVMNRYDLKSLMITVNCCDINSCKLILSSTYPSFNEA